MYFDPRPKTRKEDLFNREEELAQFKKVLSYASIIAIVGLRRTGKTSFLEVAVSEAGCPHVFLDMRDLAVVPSRAELVRKVEASFAKVGKEWLQAFAEVLKHVKGVSVAGSSVTFSWGEEGVDLSELFDKIDAWAKKHGKRFLLAIDEAQLVRGDKTIPRLLARIADSNRNIVTVVTGSEVGLLYDFLGFDNPESPLYGRHHVEIRMRNFRKEEARAFLKAGFKQVRIACSDEVIEHAVEKLDGVAGWLTLFGVRCRDASDCSLSMVDQVVEEGGKLARAEAQKIVKFSPRYGVILNFLAKAEKANWSKIKTILEAHEKRSLPSSTFTELLNRLVKTSLLEKEDGSYVIADPLLRGGIVKEPFRE